MAGKEWYGESVYDIILVTAGRGRLARCRSQMRYAVRQNNQRRNETESGESMSRRKVEVRDMLAARERRAVRQKQMLNMGAGMSLVCFTMNIAGPVKNNALIEAGFCEGARLIRCQLSRHALTVAEEYEARLYTGNELYLLVPCGAAELKRLMLPIEEAGEFGRLLDIDVLGPDGNKIGRSALNREPRGCLICGEKGGGCARNRTHTAVALYHRAMDILREYFCTETAEKISSLATRALLFEVCVTPKPGLVDRANSGAHRDMDIFTFVASSTALAPYFRRCARLGMQKAAEPPRELFEMLQYPGQCAETDMFEATGGVNTHKGAIFMIGVLCAALGRHIVTASEFSVARVMELCGEMTVEAVQAQLEAGMERPPRTAGERLYREHGIPGVRGETASGLASVRDIALPRLRQGLAAGLPLNDACVCALCHLIARVQDTALIARAGYDGQRSVSAQMAQILEETPFPALGQVKAIDAQYIQHNYSPGGCADLLAAALLLLFCEAELKPVPLWAET